jgi:hypothetical protein
MLDRISFPADLRDGEIAANVFGEDIGDFSMSWNGLDSTRAGLLQRECARPSRLR